MSQKLLITKTTIEDIVARYTTPPEIKELFHMTVLSEIFMETTTDTHPERTSSLKVVRITPSSLRRYHYDSLTHNKDIKNLRKRLDALCELLPTVFRHSKDKDGNQVLPPYEAKYNKREVTNYYQFPVFKTSNATHQDEMWTERDVDNNLIEEHFVGRRKIIGLEMDEYHKRYITENDYFDPTPLLNVDWDAILAKKPVGRPRKPSDPFGRVNKASQQRASLKDVTERLKRIEANQQLILEHLTN